MFRRTPFWPKVSRSWTKSSISAATAHFPDAVRVDPAASRTGSTSAKETRRWKLDDDTVSVANLPKPVALVVRKLQLYGDIVRFNRPVGWQLLLLPCCWGSALAVTRALVWEGADPIVLCAPLIPMHLFLQFLFGAYLMRSVGCVVNDMWDRKFDRMVERTAQRPLACGAMSMAEASAIVITHVLMAGVIALNLSPAALLASVAVTPLWIMYPFMKRITYAPQLFLGLCFNWGIFVGYAAVLGRVDLTVCLPIYCGAVVWTILYDTIYAYQDRRDDLKCGVKSTAIWIGDRKHILSAMVAPIGVSMLVSGFIASQALPFYIGILFCMHYLHAIVDDVNIYDNWSCAQGFKRNVRLGVYVFLSMCLGNLCWAVASEHESELDKTNDSAPTTSALSSFLFLNQTAQQATYNTESFNWVDRFVHPAFVQAECAKANGAAEAPPIPAWMRREYFAQNVCTILHFCGVPEATTAELSTWWYGLTDHYNMFSKLMV
ncbi:prenyltransferase [Novymonas esmeraldas]|uniref:4-hydroxybenzoate polyprenyltransferase, mitochondrial n=1 Tax=Novymonas esmeraldas TaxID=1808958 RepID=A0AAW0ERN6_9TRYP